MVALLVFAAALFASALFSEFAHRSIFSTTVLFLVVGFFAGPDFLGAITLSAESPLLSTLVEFAMFTVLFADGMALAARDLRANWRLPALALGVGLPLTVLGTAFIAHTLLGLDWLPALVIGAVLSPTDPVFASAIVGRQEIPGRLRNLLNIESGLNDGLALPIVVALLGSVTHRGMDAARLACDVVFGIALGVAVPWLGHRIEQLKAFNVSAQYEPIFAVALGLFVYATAALTGVNMFLAAFSAGVTVATVQPRFSRTFCEFGELAAELLKLGAVMAFGALISPHLLHEIPIAGYGFALLALVAVRPIALEIAFFRANLTRHERAAAYWFGPKGFASIVYGVYVLRSGIEHAPELFRLIALVVACSIVAHSSTDVVVARWFQRPARPRGGAPPGAAAA